MKSSTNAITAASAAFAAALAAGSSAGGAVLVFESDTGGAIAADNTPVPQSYGDNITDDGTPGDGFFVNGNFRYGEAGGPTPDITVDYTDAFAFDSGFAPDTASPVIIAPYYSAGFAFDVTLTASGGNFVDLASFTLGTYASGGAFTTEDLRVQIFEDGSGTPSFDSGDITLTGGDTFDSADFGSIQAAVVRIRVDELTEPGGFVALDNVQFSQVAVPEPASLAVLGLAAGLGLGRRRRRPSRGEPRVSFHAEQVPPTGGLARSAARADGRDWPACGQLAPQQE